jgi:dephospho-CoA kinase
VKRRRPIVIGVTGAPGAGKSSLAAIFAGLGATVVDADVIGRLVVETGPTLLHQLAESFGPDILASDGSLQRRELARRAFASPEATARLNALVHPPLLERVRRELKGAGTTPTPAVVLDAALILEWDARDLVNALVVVTAPEASRLARTMSARGLSETEALERTAAQWPQERKISAADYVITNDGCPDALRARALDVWHAIIG